MKKFVTIQNTIQWRSADTLMSRRSVGWGYRLVRAAFLTKSDEVPDFPDMPEEFAQTDPRASEPPPIAGEGDFPTIDWNLDPNGNGTIARWYQRNRLVSKVLPAVRAAGSP